MFVTTDKRHNALTKNSIAHSNNTIQTHSTENTILRDLLRHRDPGLKIRNLKFHQIHSQNFQIRFRIF